MSGLAIFGNLSGDLHGYLFTAIEEDVGEADEKHLDFVAIFKHAPRTNRWQLKSSVNISR